MSVFNDFPTPPEGHKDGFIKRSYFRGGRQLEPTSH